MIFILLTLSHFSLSLRFSVSFPPEILLCTLFIDQDCESFTGVCNNSVTWRRYYQLGNSESITTRAYFRFIIVGYDNFNLDRREVNPLRRTTRIVLWKLHVYFDYMRSFRVEFDEFFEDGIFSMIELGLGPCVELRYPSNPVKHGWRYPGVGEFQGSQSSFCGITCTCSSKSSH